MVAAKGIDKDILDRIFFVTEKILVFDGLDDVFEHIVKTAVMLTKAEASTIRAFDIDSGKLRIVKGYGLSNGFLSQPPIKIGEGITGRVVLEAAPFSTADVTKTKHCVHKELARLEGIKAVMSVPLKTSEGAIGCLTVYRKKAEAFTEQDLILLSIFAGQAAEVMEKTRIIEELKRQALVDSLTKVFNKNTLLKELDLKVRLADRYDHNLSVIFIDIDDFKKVNDIHGHLLGDKLLADFAKLLRQSCRNTDIVGRFGGEEFIIIAPHTDRNSALIFTQKIIDIVSRYKFLGKDGHVNVTFSAGIASFPEDGLDALELLNKADNAMYRSKMAGKNCATAWTEESAE
jgi:diguanylate cyclase (GGDEF)-like protein